MPDPMVSIVMGVFNEKKEQVEYAVGSMLDQSLSDFEFIIYDDGSDRECKAALKEISAWDDRIKLLTANTNSGLAASLNRAIGIAKGRYIARMDADDFSYPERLGRQVDFLEKNPDVAWCGCNAELFDENGIWGIRKMPEYPGHNDYLKYSPFIHPTVVYRREVLCGEGSYSEDKALLQCEDYEKFMRLHRDGYRGANLQETLFKYREDGDSYRRRGVRRRINECRTRFRNFKKMKQILPFGWLFALRPLAGIIVPPEAIRWWKRREGAKARHMQAEETVNGESRQVGF